MGVPKFYRWLSERYPKINQVITDAALLPEFDHLYLDMNGIIHGCTHPSHIDISETLSEKDMMLGIMHYLDRIITQIVKPKVSVFMAIDGVAPRAKLNQQRSRRFRSAKDLAEATKEKGLLGKIHGDDDGGGTGQKEVFDSNCITPGTEFMEKVSNCIKYFIRMKINQDPMWRKLKVIYSGHEIPGEGEHKIMQHIRDMRSQPGYKPNTRHCMYGQDADLIMLGLVSHEPHFTLLREIVDFGGFQRNDNALKAVTKYTKQSDFQLLHLSILREYMAIEFAYGLDPKTYDLEAIVDDWVFLTFLVGNDFLPHMPTLDISFGAFDLLFNTYKEQRPTWGDGEYLTKAGEISDPARLEAFLKVIGAAETDIFEAREEDQVQFAQKQRRWNKRDGKPQGPSDVEIARTEARKSNKYQAMIEDMVEKHGTDGEFIDGWEISTDPAKKDYKGRYYFEKLHFTPVDVKDHLALRKSYIEGLMWCLAYYYRGCISWSWYYPYHYGPLISDLIDLPNIFDQINFDIGAPLKPFEQLMGCLPPASSKIVPRPYRKLMCNHDSPIIQFYPEEFEVDMNGKKNPWEGVNLLPFIDINLLKETLKKFCPDKLLTENEKRRNSRGKVYVYMYDAAVNDTVPSFNRDIGISDLAKCKSRVEVLDEPSIEPTESFKPKLINGTKIPYPGFPSLNVLPMQSAELKPIQINCFGSKSKYPTTVLSLQTLPELPGADQLADNILGKSLFINWPMMHEAKVVAVSDEKCIVRMKKKKKEVKLHDEKEAQKWLNESELMSDQYAFGSGQPGSGGVSIGDVQIRLKLVTLQGMKVSSINGSSKKVFGTEEADVPLQMVLWQSPAPDPRFEEKGPITMKDRFPAQSRVVLTKGKHRGCIGSVLSVVDEKVGVKVEVYPPEPPFGLAIARTLQESYISTAEAAKALKMNPSIFSKITGSLFFRPGNFDLGLNLKYNRDFCVLGYARRRSKSGKRKEVKRKKAWGTKDTVFVVGNQRHEDNETDSDKGMVWEYTPNTVRLVAAYRQKFPKLFALISKDPTARKYEARIFGSDGVKQMSDIRKWLNNIETAKMPRTPTSTDEMPKAAIAAVTRAADVRVATFEREDSSKTVNLKIPSSALYLEGSTLATDILHHVDGESPELGDRVVNLCANGLPFGARGTVVGIHEESTGCVEVVMDKEFIGGSTLQGSCANFRGKLCVWNHLLKVNASNSTEIVDKMVPVGSGKATINSMLEDVNKGNDDKEGRDKKKTDTEVSLKVEVTQELSEPEVTKNVWNQGSPTSKIRGKQGVWREASGPSAKGTGFKGVGRGKSGLQSWQKMLASNGPTGMPKDIKTNGNNPLSKENVDSAAGLKAILGVKNESSKEPEFNTTKESLPNNATAGLKNMLGIVSSLPKISPEVEKPQPPKSAADALFQMMVQTPTNIQQAPMPVQQPGFNFTYVKEGESASSPPVVSSNGSNGNMMCPQGTGFVYPHMPMYPQMMTPQPMMTTQAAMVVPQPANEPIPLSRKKESNGVSASLVPSVTVKAKK